MGKLSQSYLKELAEKRKYQSGGFSTQDKQFSVKKSTIPGANKGLFSKTPIKQGKLIGLAHENNQPVGTLGNMHNHSETPNMQSVKVGNQRYVYATRDIQPGEELTTNYRLQPELEQPEDFMGNKRFGQKGLEKKNLIIDPKTKKLNLDAFNRLQDSLTQQEILAQSRPEGAKALPEIQIVGEKPGLGSRIKNAIRPYVAPEGGFLDQWRQRVVDETGGADWYKQPNSVLGAFSSVVTSPLQAPQYAAVYAATDGKLQTPSEALNIQNPVGAFLTDVALDPMTYVGMGVSKIPQKIGQAAIPSVKQAGKYLATQTPFKSEINWGKWNAEIPKNKSLMREYKNIERTAKQTGTWMKNPDGTPFTLPDGTPGTAEQFVQMQSQNFKKAFPEGFDMTYRGGQVYNPMLGGSSKGWDNVDDIDPNFVLFGTNNRSVAERYATNYGHGFDDYFQAKGIHPSFYHPDVNKTIPYETTMFGMNPLTDVGLYGYATPKNAQKLISNANKQRWMNVENSEVMEWLKRIDPEEYNSRTVDKEWLPDKVTTDNIAKYIKEKNIPIAEIKNVHDGADYFGNFVSSNVRAINRSMVNPKSLWYNSGMFDMTNPNIYKGVLPYALPIGAGLGAGAYQQFNQKPKGTYQMGGTMGIPGVNGQVVSSGPTPLTSVKKTRGPITKNSKGDVKTMSSKQVKQTLKYSKQSPNKL